MQFSRDEITLDERERLASGARVDSLPRAYGKPPATGVIRRVPADFFVCEILPFRLSGAGEHLYVKLRKTSQNTEWVARQLAKRFHLPFRAVGFAGLKDRHAVTEQWFSMHLAGKPDPCLQELGIDGVELVDVSRHGIKLRRGMLAGNRFSIVVSDLAGDLGELGARVQYLQTRQLPNYFGAQRFGKDAGNLQLLDVARNGREPEQRARSFGLSAIRSALFNGYLAERIRQNTWLEPLPGEIAYDASAETYIHVDKIPDAPDRYAATGILWGCGDNKATGTALSTESQYFERFGGVTGLLATYKVRMMRRPLSLCIPDLSWNLSRNSMEMRFTLSSGTYATAVLREFVEFTDSMAG